MWTPKDLDRLRQLVTDDRFGEKYGWDDIAKKLGKSAGACRNKAQRQTWWHGTGRARKEDPTGAQDTPEKPITLQEQLDRAEERRQRIRDLSIEKELVTSVAGERSFRRFLEGLIERVAPQVPVPPPPPPFPKATKDTTTESLVLMLSDWHAYEVVSAARTRGFNAYDSSIFGERVRSIVEKTISISQRLSGAGWQFPKLVISLNGDLVSGTIHEVERHSDAPSIIHAVWGTGLVLAQVVSDLAAVFPEIEIFCTSGNHGRLPDARRVQQKDPTRSWDTMIAILAREATRGLGDRVRWYMPDSYSVLFDVEGYTFLQTHGHDVKSWQGIPFYGLNRLVSTVATLEASRGAVVNYVLCGHFHNAGSLSVPAGELIVNGCFPAGTEVSVPGGVRPIEELKKGDKVFSRRGTIEEVVATTQRVAESGLIELGVKGFATPLRGTPNHLVWAIKGDSTACVCRTHCRESLGDHIDDPQWIPLENLSPGDWVQVPMLKEVGTRSIGEDLAWVYGLFVAEGHTLVRAGKTKRHHRIVFTMHKEEKAILERVQAILSPILGKPGIISVRESRTTSQLSFAVPVEVAEEWREMFGHRAENKRLPLWVYELPQSERHALVQGWLDGDGHRRIRPDGHETMTATSTSPSLAWTMAHLASDGERVPTVKILRKGGPRKHDAYYVLFNVGQDAMMHKGERFVRVCHRRRVREVVDVYDIQTTDGTFVAGAIGVHNSLIGATEFSVQALGRSDAPKQWLFGVHEDHGVTHRWPLMPGSCMTRPYEVSPWLAG